MKFTAEDFKHLWLSDITDPGFSEGCPEYYFSADKVAEIVNKILQEKLAEAPVVYFFEGRPIANYTDARWLEASKLSSTFTSGSEEAIKKAKVVCIEPINSEQPKGANDAD